MKKPLKLKITGKTDAELYQIAKLLAAYAIKHKATIKVASEKRKGT